MDEPPHALVARAEEPQPLGLCADPTRDLGDREPPLVQPVDRRDEPVRDPWREREHLLTVPAGP
jgi:hypothetical protein